MIVKLSIITFPLCFGNRAAIFFELIFVKLHNVILIGILNQKFILREHALGEMPQKNKKYFEKICWNFILRYHKKILINHKENYV